jgi:hypothetical protein
MLPVAQIIWHRTIGVLMNNELEKLWKEAVVAKFKVQFRHMHEGTEKNRKNLVRIAGIWVEIWTRDLPNTKRQRRLVCDLCKCRQWHRSWLGSMSVAVVWYPTPAWWLNHGGFPALLQNFWFRTRGFPALSLPRTETHTILRVLSDLKNGMCWQILVKFSNIKFH